MHVAATTFKHCSTWHRIWLLCCGVFCCCILVYPAWHCLFHPLAVLQPSIKPACSVHRQHHAIVRNCASLQRSMRWRWRVCEHAAAHCHHMASGATPCALRTLLPMSSHCEHGAAACCHMPAHGLRRPRMGRFGRAEAGPLVEVALQGRQVVGGHGPQQHQQQAQCRPEHPYLGFRV